MHEIDKNVITILWIYSSPHEVLCTKQEKAENTSPGRSQCNRNWAVINSQGKRCLPFLNVSGPSLGR